MSVARLVGIPIDCWAKLVDDGEVACLVVIELALAFRD